MKLPENSLFARLLRARWWVSALVGMGVFVVVRLPLDAGFGIAASLPFFVISMIVLWRELRAPRGARLEAALAELRAMPWERFSRSVTRAFESQGYAVRRAQGAADLELEKDGRVSLVCAHRWKAARTGIEPLKALAADGARRDAAECLYLCAGELTEQARVFVAEGKVKVFEGEALVRLARGSG